MLVFDKHFSLSSKIMKRDKVSKYIRFPVPIVTEDFTVRIYKFS